MLIFNITPFSNSLITVKGISCSEIIINDITKEFQLKYKMESLAYINVTP